MHLGLIQLVELLLVWSRDSGRIIVDQERESERQKHGSLN